MFLTREELIELTGGRRPSSVCHWLDRQGIRYAIARDGWPRVLRSVILVHLGAPSANNEPQLHLA